MFRLTWLAVLAVAAVGALGGVGAALWLDRSGRTPPVMPWTVPAVLLIAAAVALRLGWLVRLYRLGKRPSLDALQAARTAMYAQAAAYIGAVLAGGYGGYALVLTADWGHEPRRDTALAAGVAALVAVGLCAAGWIAERWCDAGPDDEGRGGGVRPSADPA